MRKLDAAVAQVSKHLGLDRRHHLELSAAPATARAEYGELLGLALRGAADRGREGRRVERVLCESSRGRTGRDARAGALNLSSRRVVRVSVLAAVSCLWLR